MRPERRDFLPGARPVQAEALVGYGIFNERIIATTMLAKHFFGAAVAVILNSLHQSLCVDVVAVWHLTTRDKFAVLASCFHVRLGRRLAENAVKKQLPRDQVSPTILPTTRTPE
jgi:hypothetical protein